MNLALLTIVTFSVISLWIILLFVGFLAWLGERHKESTDQVRCVEIELEMTKLYSSAYVATRFEEE